MEELKIFYINLPILLTCLDIDFRYSLYKHNQYHVINNGLDVKYSLTKSKFSYRNIHQNISGVR